MAEGTKHKDIVIRVYPVEIRGTDPEAKERGIKSPNDWRNADHAVTDLEYCRVYSRDQQFNQHQGAVEPDYDLGWYVMHQGTNKVIWEFKGPCPEPFRTSLLEGTHLFGIVGGRDVSQHN